MNIQFRLMHNSEMWKHKQPIA